MNETKLKSQSTRAKFAMLVTRLAMTLDDCGNVPFAFLRLRTRRA